MLGFIEATSVADIVASGMTLPDGRVIPPGGPAGWFGNPAWIPWRTQIPTYLCPSDLNPGVQGNFGGNSYAFSVGDSMGVNWNDNNYNDRGPFGTHLRVKRFRDCIDGLSNTVAMSERPYPMGNFTIRTASGERRLGPTVVHPEVMTSPATCLANAVGNQILPGVQIKGRFGSMYTDAQVERVGFNTVLAPNSVSCTNNNNPNADSTGGALSAGSYHPGGVNVLLMDGSVRFVSETIDTGNTALPPVTGGFSPYGVWGSMGSRAGGEPVSLD